MSAKRATTSATVPSEQRTRVLAELARGVAAPTVARRSGLTAAQVKAIEAEGWPELGDFLDRDLVVLLRRLLSQCMAVVEDAQLEYDLADSSSTRIAALRLRFEAITEMWRLLSDRGFVPSNMNLWDVEAFVAKRQADLNQVVGQIVGVLLEEKVPVSVLRRIQDELATAVQPEPDPRVRESLFRGDGRSRG